MQHFKNDRKFESINKAAALAGRLWRTNLCSCGRAAKLVRKRHHWRRLACCSHCLEAAAIAAVRASEIEHSLSASRRAA